MNGKGDRNRTSDYRRFAANYATIFGRCSEHPKYEGKRKPRVDCMTCRRIWREKQLAG